MGKYFDKLVKMNENLTKELKDKGLVLEDTKEDEISIPKDALTDDQKKDILVDKGVDQKTVDAMKDPDEISSALDATLNNDNVEKESSAGSDVSDMDWDGPAIIKWFDPEKDVDSFYVKDGEWSTDIQNAYEFPGKEDAADKIELLLKDNKEFTKDNMFIWSANMKKEELDESINESDGEVYLRMDDDDLDIHGYIQWDEENVAFVDDEEEAHIFDSKTDAEAAILDICDKFNYDPETFSTQEVDSQVSDNGENWVSLDPTDATATTIA